MKQIIVIVGPTGVGKTKLSIALAKHFNGEIINADSVQIYKELNIGTAKIKTQEKENIPHHLIDIKKVEDNYSVFDYQSDARKIIDAVLKRGKTPIIVGGTGLYIKALLYDYRFMKEEKRADYNHLSNQELIELIKKYDFNTDVDQNNRRRLIRVLNKYANNEDIMDQGGDVLLYDAVFIGLTTERKILYERINNRVDKMIEAGLVEEAKGLYNRGVNSKAIMTAIGYKELYKYFDKKITLKESIDLIKKNSRHYAKRQYTWFNNKMDINWFEVDINNFNNTTNQVIGYINQNIV